MGNIIFLDTWGIEETAVSEEYLEAVLKGSVSPRSTIGMSESNAELELHILDGSNAPPNAIIFMNHIMAENDEFVTIYIYHGTESI